MRALLPPKGKICGQTSKPLSIPSKSLFSRKEAADQANSLHLIDFGFSGPKHTWARGTRTDTKITKRLDRFFMCLLGRLYWSDACVSHLEVVLSDHSPILLRMESRTVSSPRRRPFRFLMRHSNFHTFIRYSWDNEEMTIVALLSLSVKLEEWNRTTFGNINIRKDKLLRRLKGISKALDKGATNFLLGLQQELYCELEKMLEEEELIWFQKARDKWILFGDNNTKYFHASTIVRRRRNRVEALQDGNGDWVTDQTDLEDMAVNFYSSLYSEEEPSRLHH
ncbi:LOW QUALITY PROTEIN: hypothetical protein V2J09_023365 [Rumex salicifolius]